MDTFFRIVLPVYLLLGAAALAWQRRRLARLIGRDPIVIRPFRALATPHEFLVSTLSLDHRALVAIISPEVHEPQRHRDTEKNRSEFLCPS